jgi:hypothetical protein
VLPRLSIASVSIRARLTVWYALVLATVLLLFAAATAGVLYFQLFHQLTRFAIQDVETIEGLLFFAPDRWLQLSESRFPAMRISSCAATPSSCAKPF